MSFNNKIIKTTTMTAVVATLAGTAMAGAIVPSAFAVADTKTENDIVIKNSSSTNPAAQVDGHKFTAYRIADYKDVQFTGGGDDRHATGYDMQQTDAAIKSATLNAIKDATTTTSNGAVTVNSNWTNLIAVTSNSIKFKGDATALSPIQFVGKYFYGTGSDVYGNSQADKKEMRAFADSLVKSNVLQAGTDATGANGEARFALNDDQAGLYLIVEKTPSTGNNTNANGQTTQTISRAMVTGTAFVDKADVAHPVYVNKLVNDKGTTYTLGELKLKADTVTVNKETTSVNGKDTKNDALIGLGSVRGFTITTNVPNYMNNYQDWVSSGNVPEFTVNDDPSDNLLLKKAANEPQGAPDYGLDSTLKVFVDSDGDGKFNTAKGDKELIKGTDYTLTKSVDGGNKFSVKLTFGNGGALDATKLKALSGKHIVLTYSAKVNGLINKTDNSVDVTYSNDPYKTTTTTAKDKERLYEGDLKLQKIKYNDKTHVTLNGAKFKVWAGDTAGADDAALNFLKNNDGYLLNTKGQAAAAGETTTREITFGETTLKGLALDSEDVTNGVNYHFKETTAPAGYILGDHPVEFTVNVKPQFAADGELTGVIYHVTSATHGNFIDESDASIANGTAIAANTTDAANTVVTSGVARIENTTDIKDFAKTGGQILTYIASAAVLLIIGAGALGVTRVRRNKED